MTRAFVLVLFIAATAFAQPPVSADPRLVVEPFAAAPDIVHPIAVDFDAKGRLLVVESHTHFRPAKYVGPTHDRIRVLEDTDGDGKADRFTTFFEGTTFTMDVAAHPDGSVYVATRNEILRLRDTDGDGKADEKTRIVFLETAGNYPHNGLSGLAFDSRGDLIFGMGENLGAAYKLIGSDGTTLTGGGEGGGVFHCMTDGKKLRRTATGFWNPFGATFDIHGRLFVVDNDPDSSPPCRLLHVVEGGDYGFQFRYGRSGRHPFQSWNGELPGTLPMVAGTGESPCEVVCYESDGLPAEYRGDLLVPIWADHRVERYRVRADGAGVKADRLPFVTGGKEFRPSGLATAPDGSLFLTDWVSQSYELHGKGAVWHIRVKDAKPAARPTDPKLALESLHRPTRDAAARTLAKTEVGREYLRGKLSSSDVRVRAAVLTALIDANDPDTNIFVIAQKEPAAELRALALKKLAAGGDDVSAFLDATHPAPVRMEAVAGVRATAPLVDLLADADPYLRHAAIQRLGKLANDLDAIDPTSEIDRTKRAGLLLAHRATGRPAPKLLADFLADDDPEVRLLAVKWVADDRLVAYRGTVAAQMARPTLDPRTFLTLATALARIENKPVSDDELAMYFVARLADPKTPAATKFLALRAVPGGHKSLKPEVLTGFLTEDGVPIRIEALRALAERGDGKAAAAILAAARDANQPPAVRTQAIATGVTDVEALLAFATGPHPMYRAEALRALTKAILTDDQRSRVAAIPTDPQLVARVLGKPFATNRPPATDTAAWLKLLKGRADVEAGRRVFENAALTGCTRCHRVDGRGGVAGPDLSLIGRTERRWIVESILKPSAVVAPHFQAWQVETADGKSRTGLLVRTYLDESTYMAPTGEPFKVLATDVTSIAPAKVSVMPDALFDKLTDSEVRDLVAYLEGRK